MIDGVGDLFRAVGFAQVPGEAAQPGDIVRMIQHIRQMTHVGLIARCRVVIRTGAVPGLEMGIPSLSRLVVCRQAGNGSGQRHGVRIHPQGAKRAGELVLCVRLLHVGRVAFDESDGAVSVGGEKVVDGVIEQIILFAVRLHGTVYLGAVHLSRCKQFLVVHPAGQPLGQLLFLRSKTKLPGRISGVLAQADVLRRVPDALGRLHGGHRLAHKPVLQDLLHDRALLLCQGTFPAGAVRKGAHRIHHPVHKADLLRLVLLHRVDVRPVDGFAPLLAEQPPHDALRCFLVHDQHGHGGIVFRLPQQFPGQILRLLPDLLPALLDTVCALEALLCRIVIRQLRHGFPVHGSGNIRRRVISIRDAPGKPFFRLRGIEPALRLLAGPQGFLPGLLPSPRPHGGCVVPHVRRHVNAQGIQGSGSPPGHLPFVDRIRALWYSRIKVEGTRTLNRT